MTLFKAVYRYYDHRGYLFDVSVDDINHQAYERATMVEKRLPSTGLRTIVKHRKG